MGRKMWSSSHYRITFTIFSSLLLLLSFASGHSYRRSPISYISLIENPHFWTPSQRIHSRSHFDLTFTLHKGAQDIKFSLEPNEDIIPESAKVEYLDENGNIARTESLWPHRHSMRVFKGTAWVQGEGDEGWRKAGWARVLVKRDGDNPLFTGAFVLDHDAHHIQLKSWYLKTKHELDPHLEESGEDFMVVFRDSDIGGRLGDGVQIPLVKRTVLDDQTSQCGADNLTLNMGPRQNPILGMDISPRDEGLFGLDTFIPKKFKRQFNVDSTNGGGFSGGVNLRNSIGNTAGCPNTKLVALAGVATDCTYTSQFSTEEEMRQHVISQFNSASTLFENTFNISLGIQNLIVSKATCPGTAPSTAPWNLPCSGSVDIAQRLSLMSQWRGTRSDDKNAFWTLLTDCASGSSVGLAWVGMLCRPQADQGTDGEYRSSANVVAKTATEWKVIAHEIGHTFGAVHDCTSQTCAESQVSAASMCCPLSSGQCDARGQFLMNPSTDDKINNFSPCTVGNICSGFNTGSVSKTCLSSNKNVNIITENRCGNGIVEKNEECDCGGTEGCGNNPCCDPKTCKFKDKAVCDDSNDDCCTNCRFSPSTKVCRLSNGKCDPQETCSGTSATCPDDITKPDGESCGNGLACASGQCTSRNRQCQVIMGVETGNNDTVSCNDSGCTILCASPKFGSNVCLSVQQNFLDGTPCGGDGKCRNGVCKGASAFGEVKSWIMRNKKLVIIVASIIGGVFVLSILSCIFRRLCCGKRRVKRKVLPPPPPPIMPINTTFSGNQQMGYTPYNEYASGHAASYYGGGGRGNNNYGQHGEQEGNYGGYQSPVRQGRNADGQANPVNHHEFGHQRSVRYA